MSVAFIVSFLFAPVQRFLPFIALHGRAGEGPHTENIILPEPPPTFLLRTVVYPIRPAVTVAPVPAITNEQYSGVRTVRRGCLLDSLLLLNAITVCAALGVGVAQGLVLGYHKDLSRERTKYVPVFIFCKLLCSPTSSYHVARARACSRGSTNIDIFPPDIIKMVITIGYPRTPPILAKFLLDMYARTFRASDMLVFCLFCCCASSPSFV